MLLWCISCSLFDLPCCCGEAPVRSGPLVEIEVLDGGLTARGTYMGALRLTLQTGWKTYWRSPGDAGIPPSFDWRGSRNIGSLAIIWPTPEVTMTSGYQTIGYHDQLVLPIEITPNTSNQPHGHRLCREWIPHQLRWHQHCSLLTSSYAYLQLA